MVHLQMQLPEEIVARAGILCRARGISFAELAQQGIERMLNVCRQDLEADWQLPTPRHLGWRGLNDDQIKAQSRFPAGVESAGELIL
jgi:hypothetical protein